MTDLFKSTACSSIERSIRPLRELGSYEALWDQRDVWFKSMAKLFSDNVGSVPSDFIDEATSLSYSNSVIQKFHASSVDRFGVAVNGMLEFPEKLNDARDPIVFLYYQGNWSYVQSPCVSVVGTREPTKEGVERAKNMTRGLVESGYTIVSGLAKGIDTASHRTALALGGRTIAVLGTPLSENYPKDNSDLQAEIAANHLIVSQVPVCRYLAQSYKQNRLFFPERNKLMSALSVATVIIEAGETSGTLVQAQSAIDQGRKLFILDSCFSTHKWPEKFEKKGAIRVKTFDDIKANLPKVNHSDATAPSD
jgi:DNA processing protein